MIRLFRFIAQGRVIAARDFRAVVATPTFILFLLAPVFMLSFGFMGGTGASRMEESTSTVTRIAAIANATDGEALKAADMRMREFASAPKLEIVPTHGDDAQVARGLLGSSKADYVAVMHGPLDSPSVLHEESAKQSAAWLRGLAERVVLERKSGVAAQAPAVEAHTTAVKAGRAGLVAQKQTGYLAVVVVFVLTLLLAGQAVGMLAEEKSNKVIEIIAAAVPLEAVFIGKLVGMFGVALLFISFWGAVAVTALLLVPGASEAVTLVQPAVGLPMFGLLCALYFTMSYMLLGAVFLGIGGLAATVREIQMLSFPITILQMLMFGLATAGATDLDAPVGKFAQIFPLSSPYVMAARGASDPSLWPHVAALAWQGLWVSLIIWLAARAFRHGVLKSGGGLSLFGRKQSSS